jgi:hypothetical protein
MSTLNHLELALADAVSTRLAEQTGEIVPAEEIAYYFKHRSFPDDYFWSAWDSNVADMTDAFQHKGN